MELREIFPIIDKLDTKDTELLERSARKAHVSKGKIVYTSSDDCLGFLIVRSGQLRACIYSDEGKEITVYRLFDRDMCLFAASCIMRSIRFDITIMAEKDTDVIIIPPEVFKSVMDRSAPLANYTNEIMQDRLSDVMWLIEQVMWKSFDKRLASFLCEESAIEETNRLKITHEQIAGHLGSAREVVTRMLKYFQDEGMVRLSRGTVEIVDIDTLREYAD